jgi:hypothetical protein
MNLSIELLPLLLIVLARDFLVLQTNLLMGGGEGI